MKQYLLNLVLLGDLAVSTILGGYPRDTVSIRIARARANGSIPACFACAYLSWVWERLFRSPRDHCTWALDQTTSIGAEVWHWGGPNA